MKEINFDATSEEATAMSAIRERAQGLGDTRDPVDIEMDLLATNGNGCPLDFQKLLEVDDFNFLHDLSGIARHLDRSTGKLGGCFLPRCARG